MGDPALHEEVGWETRRALIHEEQEQEEEEKEEEGEEEEKKLSSRRAQEPDGSGETRKNEWTTSRVTFLGNGLSERRAWEGAIATVLQVAREPQLGGWFGLESIPQMDGFLCHA